MAKNREEIKNVILMKTQSVPFISSLSIAFLFLLAGSVSQGQNSMNVELLSNWKDLTLPASTTWNNTYNEVWGYASEGREYGIIGSTNGTHIIDITNPTMPEEVVFIEGASTGPQVIHRHFDNYGHYLYMVCDEGAATLQIADLSFLPDSAPIVYDSDELFSRAHNCFIDTATAHLYVVGNSSWCSVYSLANPESPELLIDCRYDLPFWSSIGYLHDIFVRNDTAYCNAETRGLFVVDFSDISNPTMIGSLPVYVQQGYNHSGSLMADAPFYAMADETHGMAIKIVDVSDMQNLMVTDTIRSGVNQFSIPHNLLYHDGMLYISYYFDGMYVFDCSNPANPVLAGFYDTSLEPHADNDYRGNWGVYPYLPSGIVLASDMQSGLWVLDPSQAIGTGISGNVVPSSSRQLSVFPNPVSTTAFVDRGYSGNAFTVFDATGRIHAKGMVPADGKLLDASLMIPGMYIIQIEQREFIYSCKFLKM